MLAFTERNRDKITCINISRHLTKYVEESPDEVVARIATPKRVNCVLYMDYPADELVDYAAWAYSCLFTQNGQWFRQS